MNISEQGDFLAVMQRSLPGDKYLADAFGKNWRNIHPNQSLRLVDFQMNKINSEVSYFSFFGNKMTTKEYKCPTK